MTIFEKITTAVLAPSTTIQPVLCTRFRTPKADCTLCADLCPAGAITLSGAGPEIGPACCNCGVCYAVCPTDAFGRKQGSDEEILFGLNRLEEKKSCRISCQRGDGDADLLVSCLGRLTEALLLRPLHASPDIKLEIVQPACAGCPMAKAVSLFANLLTRVGHLYDLVGAGRERISVTRIPLGPLRNGAAEGTTGSRREFLGAVREQAANVMMSALPSIPEDESGPAVNGRERPMNRKRADLLESLRILAEKRKARPVSVSACESMTAELAISSRCTACGVCAAVCPTGALVQENIGPSIVISFRAGLCVNCGICAKVCGPGAIEENKTVLLSHMLDAQSTELFSAPRHECRVCRLDFVGEGVDGICPLCVDQHRRQQNAIKNLFETREL